MPMSFEQFIAKQSEKFTADDIPALLRDHVWDEDNGDWEETARQQYPEAFADDPPQEKEYHLTVYYTEENNCKGHVTIRAQSPEEAIRKFATGDHDGDVEEDKCWPESRGDYELADDYGVQEGEGSNEVLDADDAAEIWKQCKAEDEAPATCDACGEPFGIGAEQVGCPNGDQVHRACFNAGHDGDTMHSEDKAND